MNVRFCPFCRSLILANFSFCPYCGEAVKGPDLSEALGAPFDRIARAQDKPPEPSAGNPFSAAEASLSRLEADMDLILEALAKEGRGGSA